MKSTLRSGLIAFLLAVIFVVAMLAIVPAITAHADNVNITCATATGNYLNEDYLSVYKIPTSMMTYESSGGASSSAPLSNAFDGRWNTYWETATENSGQQNANPTFLNAITVTFSQAVTIESIVYASSSSREGHGYPTTLNIYTGNNTELALYGTCVSTPTNNRVVFTFNEAVTVTQIKFEFRVVNTWHNWTATAKEICLMQPDNASVNKVLDLFDDYTQLSVKDEYKSSLSNLRNDVLGLLSYESALKPLLDRADLVVSGQLSKDAKREFSTDPNAANVINQWGDMRSYAGNTLKMSQFGINRQVLGVGGLAGQTITIYVEADEGDPLPSVAFSQVYGHWRSWQATSTLSRGKNVLTFPNLVTSDYSTNVTAGGTIHIINPYDPSQQSSNVKVYVEGGFLYPVFRKGGDVDAYREELTSYYNEMQSVSGMCNVTEVVCDHVILTFGATVGYNNYVTRNVDPQKNVEGWDGYLRMLMEFDGISFSPDGEYYNEKNLHLYTNFRMTQDWAGAFAFSAYDHIGFTYIDESTLANYNNNLGWGFAHEVGHALDVNGRTKNENTNNMWAKYAVAYLNHDVSRNMNAGMTNALTPDETAVSSHYFGTGDNWYSYQLWWNLEAVHHGFWGKLDNLYRYYDENAARTAAGVTSADGRLTDDERIVYYSSLVVGEDLGYLYERFGFSFSANSGSYAPFNRENASAAYKKLMSKALQDGAIEEKNIKYWYLDANQYFYDAFNGSCYNPSVSVEVRDVWKTASGYMLLFPDANDNVSHLGYEIMEYRNGNWYVIGFTHSESYIDTTTYADGYVPQYKVRAYDRGMGVSAESKAVTYTATSQSKVCRIGETYYNSLTEAVAAANAGDTIYICKDLYDGSITVNKNLTLLPDPSLSGSVVITKNSIGAIFTVNGGVTFVIGNSDGSGATIALDGNLFSQNGSLITVNSSYLNVYNAELRNNRSTDHGGAVYNTGVSTFTHVTFKNNTAGINGGAIANFSGGVLTLTDCIFNGNTAKGNGGAITIDGRTALIRTVITGNTAMVYGGAMFISPSKNYNSRYVSIEGGEISGNTAGQKGSAIYQNQGIITFDGGDVKMSGEIYKNNGSVTVNTALPDLSKVTFLVPSVTGGAVLLTATGGLTFNEEFVSALQVELADAYLGEINNTVLLKPWPTVTFDVNGTITTQQVSNGSFVLPDTVEGLDESKYITEWEYNGKRYSAGATVEIIGDCVLTAVSYGSKFAVTLKFDEENTKTLYVKPDGTLVLDECGAPQGKEFSHWDVNGVAYKAGDTVKVTGDTVITAVFSDLPVDDGNNDPQDPSNHMFVWLIVVAAIALAAVVGLVITIIVTKNKKSKQATPTE